MPFQKGQVANPNGRPKKTVEEKYLKRLQKCVSIEDWEKIVNKAVKQAQNGDTAARKWLSDYLMGVPVQKTELTGADGGGLKVIVEYANREADTTGLPQEPAGDS